MRACQASFSNEKQNEERRGSLRRCRGKSRRIDRARRRGEFRAIRLLSKIRRRNKWLRQILRVLDDRRHGEPLEITRAGMTIVVLSDDGVLAVWHAVGPQVARSQPGRHDLEVSAGN